MNRKKRIRKITLLFGSLMLGLLFRPLDAQAAVTTTADASGGADAIYVAGCPDMYPVEYYNSDTENYEGIMPAILEHISEETEIDFVYIRGGNFDRRTQLAKNKQVELVSGLLLPAEETVEKQLQEKYLTEETAVFTVTADGTKYRAAFGFTEIADEKLREAVRESLNNISPEEMTELAVSVQLNAQREILPAWGFYLLAAGVVLLTILLVILAANMRRLKREAEENHMTDKLTGIGNKQYFMRAYATFVTRQTRLLYFVFYYGFDIQRVNRYYGEDEAEKILCYAAEILSARIRQGDFCARVSGGGFAAVCMFPSQDEAEKWGAQVQEQMNSYGEKFGKDYTPYFHCGIYRLQKADEFSEKALYNAEQGYHYALAHRLPYAFSDTGRLKAVQEQKEIQNQMISAIEKKEFKCYIQFIVRAEDSKIYAAEVLSRWEHPEKGLLMPGKYVESMEENDTIKELDFYMFEETCRLLERFAKSGYENLRLFCNFSRKTFSLSEFGARIKEIAGRYQFPHEMLCVEITESAIADNKKEALVNVQMCRDEGYMMALDDVGSGYTSVTDLNDYPVDIAKIDRDILLKAAEEGGERLLGALHAFFRTLHIQTLCEGIETQEQYDMVCGMGVDLVQGFYIQHALPVKEALRWMKEREGQK